MKPTQKQIACGQLGHVADTKDRHPKIGKTYVCKLCGLKIVFNSGGPTGLRWSLK